MDEALSILIQHLKEFEGCRLKAYQDTGGVWTVGYGCTGPNIVKSTVWTQAYADSALKERAAKALSNAIKYSPTLADKSPYRQAAIASFIFNCGSTAYKNSTLKKCVDTGEWDKAQVQIQRWNKDNGRIIAGLARRRTQEAHMLA